MRTKLSQREDGKYVRQKYTDDILMTKLQLDLKLRVCREIAYPFIIIKVRTGAEYRPELHERIVDGTVGQALFKKYFEKRGQPELTFDSPRS